MLFVVLIASVSCTTTARHKILTVIFTGVPPLEGSTTDVQQDSDMTGEDLQAARQARFRTAMQSDYWVHGPFDAGHCDRCHSSSESLSFRVSGPAQDREVDPLSRSGQSFSGRLVLPLEALCSSCHTVHNGNIRAGGAINIHAPAEQGQCTACHHPHQSQRRYMLLDSDNRTLCGRCHDDSSLSHATPAEGDMQLDCMDCHNAHVGRSTQLLKRDGDELPLLYPFASKQPKADSGDGR